MPISEGEQYLVQENRSPLHAFDKIKLKYPIHSKESINRLPQVEVGNILGDYFTAGVAYLANVGPSEYFKEIGTKTWEAVNQKRVNVIYYNDAIFTSVSLGVPIKEAIENFQGNDKSYVFFGGYKKNNKIIFTSNILLPKEFILNSINMPLEVLGEIAFLCSQVRDLENDRLLIDPNNLTPRAIASEAELFKIYNSQGFKTLDRFKYLEKYPDGLNSLPRPLKY